MICQSSKHGAGEAFPTTGLIYSVEEEKGRAQLRHNCGHSSSEFGHVADVDVAAHQKTMICRLVSLILPASANLHCFQSGRRTSMVTQTPKLQRLPQGQTGDSGEAATGDPHRSVISSNAGCRIAYLVIAKRE